MTRYLLSKLLPTPMRSTYAARARARDLDEHRDSGWADHSRTDDHHDLVSASWWQWRDRCFGQRTTATCIG